ncbi:MAG: hypothetical protein F6K65_07300 [Moorea sp. SIO3C2]|nr:hypothetical protein [Moorena sp. SIO3C2]
MPTVATDKIRASLLVVRYGTDCPKGEEAENHGESVLSRTLRLQPATLAFGHAIAFNLQPATFNLKPATCNLKP